MKQGAAEKHGRMTQIEPAQRPRQCPGIRFSQQLIIVFRKLAIGGAERKVTVRDRGKHAQAQFIFVAHALIARAHRMVGVVGVDPIVHEVLVDKLNIAMKRRRDTEPPIMRQIFGKRHALPGNPGRHERGVPHDSIAVEQMSPVVSFKFSFFPARIERSRGGVGVRNLRVAWCTRPDCPSQHARIRASLPDSQTSS